MLGLDPRLGSGKERRAGVKRRADSASLNSCRDVGLVGRCGDGVEPDVVAGWALLEQMDGFEEGCQDYGFAVHALHVATRRDTLGGSFTQLGCEGPALDVLFVRELIDGFFQRLGVGRIFDRHFVDLFHDVENADIILI